MDRALWELVWERAEARCEYCRMPQACDELTLQVDHIVARQHGGPTNPGNLGLACYACNHHKGPNLTGIDPATGRIERLFHPRRHRWGRHFRWDGPLLVGRTAIGRTTVAVLAINLPYRVALRRRLIAEGAFPND
jgi:hypothetical protein